MKHFRALIPIGLTLIGAMVIDYLAPWPYIMTQLYAIPVLIAAYRLPPRGVAVIAGPAMVINLMSGLLEGTPLDVVLLYTSGLLITGYLSIALARQRLEIARYADLAEQHAQATELAHQRLQEFLAMVVHDLPPDRDFTWPDARIVVGRPKGERISPFTNERKDLHHVDINDRRAAGIRHAAWSAWVRHHWHCVG